MIKKATFHIDNFSLDDGLINDKNAILAIGNVQSGKTRFMIKNTKLALMNDFDAVILIGGTNNNLLNQSYTRFNNDLRDTGFPVYEIKDSEFDFLPSEKVIITTLKHQDSLERINLILKESVDKKVLIFDDESDFGSINISSDGTKSKIHKEIKALYENIEKGIFISVTATPFADVMSNDSFVFDKLIKIVPGDGYKGVKEFNNSSCYEIVVESDEFRSGGSPKEWFPIVKDHVQRIFDGKYEVSQLLINNYLDNKNNNKIIETLHKVIEVMQDSFENFFGINNASEEYFKILKELKENIYLLNQYNTTWNKNTHSIVVGGALVSRGYTFPELKTTIMLNEPKGLASADTMLQRARWFGYRQNMEHIKVYMSANAYEAYKEMEILNEELFNESNAIFEELKEKLENMEFDFIKLTGKVKNE